MALVQFFKSGSLDGPVSVHEAPDKNAEDVGYVVPSFEEGVLFLTDEEGQIFRLSWEQRQGEVTPKDRRRALPSGEYRLTSYRILDRSTEDMWHIAATAKRIVDVKIVSGETEEIEIDRSIKLGQRFGQGMIFMSVQGMKKAGLSIYKNERRIPMGWQLNDRDGKEVQSGKINYG